MILRTGLRKQSNTHDAVCPKTDGEKSTMIVADENNFNEVVFKNSVRLIAFYIILIECLIFSSYLRNTLRIIKKQNIRYSLLNKYRHYISFIKHYFYTEICRY